MSRPDEKAYFCRSCGAAFGRTCAQMNAHIQPPWGDTSLARVGALTIQAWQLDIVGEEERQREAKKEKGDAKKSN